MKRSMFLILSIVLGSLATVAFVLHSRSTILRGSQVSHVATRFEDSNPHLKELYRALPLAFEPREDSRVRSANGSRSTQFIAHGHGYSVALSGTEALLSAHSNGAPQGGLRLALLNANRAASLKGEDTLPGVSNYFRGSDPSSWRTHVAHFAKIRATDVYSGVDLVYYGNHGHLECDFIVASGADPRKIRLKFDEAKNISLDADGNLIVASSGSNAELRLLRPVVYQQKGGQRVFIGGGYQIERDSQVVFDLPVYNRNLPLVIDPVLDYSTFIGGEDLDEAYSIAVDSKGSAYITGETYSTQFPTTLGAFDRTCGTDGTCNSAATGQIFSDAFVVKLDPSGTSLIYSTYIGGSSFEYGHDIALDPAGSAYITGWTGSPDFPVTKGAFQTAYAGSVPGGLGYDAFVTKLSPDGSSLVYSTYLGGSAGEGDDLAFGIALDASGNAYVTGETSSTDFPTTAGALQPACSKPCNPDAFITKLNPTGTALVYSTYLGGTQPDSGQGIAVDSDGSAYVTGDTWSLDFPVTPGAFQPTHGGGTHDAFVSKLSPDGKSLAYSTFLGGADFDQGTAIAVDSSKNAYVTGNTHSANFPTKNPLVGQLPVGGSAFLTKLNPTGAALVYSMFSGGGARVTLDSLGNVYVFGGAVGLPLVNPIQNSSPGMNNFYLAKYDPTGSQILFSTLLGGSGFNQYGSVAVDAMGNMYVTGTTTSTDFPILHPFQLSYAGGFDVIAARVSLANSTGVSFAPGVIVFPAQLVGTVSSAQPVVLQNAGSSVLPIGAIASGGPFTQSNNCGTSLAAGAQCSFNVSFDPTAPGLATGYIEVSDNTSNNQYYVVLTGTGAVRPIATIGPSSLDFGTRVIGSPATKDVTLSNTGNAALHISIIGISATDYTQTNNCGASVLAGASCTIHVTFNPSSYSPGGATLVITDNAPDSPQSVPLTGAGATFLLRLADGASNSMTINAGQTANYSLMVDSSNRQDTLSLTCAASIPLGTCGASPAQLQLPLANSTAVTLSATTTARGILPMNLTPPWFAPTWHWAELVVCLMLCCYAAWHRKILSRAGSLRPVPILTFLLFTFLLAGCQGGGTPPPPPQPGTPAGTYKLTVSAASSANSPTQTIQLTLQVN